MNRGDIWLVALDPTIGAEITKTRPALIVSDDAVGALPLKIIVPVTEWHERFAQARWLVRIAPDPQNGLTKASAADVFQVRSVSTLRLRRRLGQLSDGDMRRIEAALSVVFRLSL